METNTAVTATGAPAIEAAETTKRARAKKSAKAISPAPKKKAAAKTPAKKAAPKAPAAKKAAAPKKAAKEAKAPKAESKGATILALIGRKGGATLAEIMSATSWQAHSVRGWISTAGKKGTKIESSKNAAGERTYKSA